MLQNTDSSFDGVMTINEHDEFNQSIYRAIVDIASANITNSRMISTLADSLWETHLDRDTVDHLDGESFGFEAALVAIHNGTIPVDNFYFQSLVVRLAYNAITDSLEFAWMVENSRFTKEQIQHLIDTAASTVLWHPNFALAETEEGGNLMYLYGKNKPVLCKTCGK